MAAVKTPLKGPVSTYTDVHWGYRLRHHYGITPDDYNKMLVAQNGVCAICKQPPRGKMKRLSVDHCHASKEVRGLLCVTCNRTVGYLDNPEWTERALSYLAGDLAKDLTTAVGCV